MFWRCKAMQSMARESPLLRPKTGPPLGGPVFVLNAKMSDLQSKYTISASQIRLYFRLDLQSQYVVYL